MKYYINKVEGSSNKQVMTDRPVNMDGVDVVDLPGDFEFYTVKGRDKEYMAHKVALAIAGGQISIDDISPVKE